MKIYCKSVRLHGFKKILMPVMAVFLFIVVAASCVGEGGDGSKSKNTGAIEIPQDFKNGWLTVPVRLNDRAEVDLIVDIGMPLDGIALFHKETAMEAELPGKEYGEEEKSTYTVERVALEIGDRSLGKKNVFVMNETRDNSILEADGIVGTMLFDSFLVEMDFDNAMLKLHERGSFYTGEGWIPVPLKIVGGIPYFDLIVSFDGNLLIPIVCALDMGSANYYLRLKENPDKKLLIPDYAKDSYLGDAVSGDFFGSIFRIVSLRWERITVEGLITQMSEPDAKVFAHGGDGSIGLGLLSRFNLVFDYRQSVVYMKMNEKFDDPYLYNMSGFETRVRPGNIYEIAQVFDNSPAQEADIRVGDILISVDGKSRGAFYFHEIEHLFQQRGQKVLLTLRRGEDIIEKEIVLRELF